MKTDDRQPTTSSDAGGSSPRPKRRLKAASGRNVDPHATNRREHGLDDASRRNRRPWVSVLAVEGADTENDAGTPRRRRRVKRGRTRDVPYATDRLNARDPTQTANTAQAEQIATPRAMSGFP